MRGLPFDFPVTTVAATDPRMPLRCAVTVPSKAGKRRPVDVMAQPVRDRMPAPPA
jgi:hypothetical protein